MQQKCVEMWRPKRVTLRLFAVMAVLALPVLALGARTYLRRKKALRGEGVVITPWGEVTGNDMQPRQLARGKAQLVDEGQADFFKQQQQQQGAGTESHDLDAQIPELLEAQHPNLPSNSKWQGWEFLRSYRLAKDSVRLTPQEEELAAALQRAHLGD